MAMRRMCADTLIVAPAPPWSTLLELLGELVGPPLGAPKTSRGLLDMRHGFLNFPTGYAPRVCSRGGLGPRFMCRRICGAWPKMPPHPSGQPLRCPEDGPSLRESLGRPLRQPKCPPKHVAHSQNKFSIFGTGFWHTAIYIYIRTHDIYIYIASL